MGPQHIRDGVMHSTRGKTENTSGIDVFIPIHSELQSVVDAAPSGHLTFLVTEWGSRSRLQAFAKGLPHAAFHCIISISYVERLLGVHCIQQ